MKKNAKKHPNYATPNMLWELIKLVAFGILFRNHS